MLLHYFKISLRNIWKDRAFSSINILGLAVAIACCFLLIFWVKHELSYENCYSNADRIYRVLSVEERESGKHHNTWIQPGISSVLKSKFPQIEGSTFFHKEDLPMAEDGTDNEGIMSTYVNADKDFLRMFSLDYIEGTPQSVVESKGVIITEDLAHRLFGTESAIGKIIQFSKVRKEGMLVSGVVKRPKNTEIIFDVLDTRGRITSGIHYIMLDEKSTITPDFEEQVATFLSTISKSKNTLKLQAIKDMHLSSPEEIATNKGSLNQIILFSIAALLILIIAVVSYINGSIAQALNRLKEVGIRKVVGGKRKHLIERFLCEYFIISLLAVIVSMAVVQILFPYFSEIMGNKIELITDWSTILIVFLVCIILTLLSGGYSAFYLSKFNPILAFRGGSITGSKEGLRKILIGVQFLLSIAIFTCTVFIYKQINMMLNADTGIEKENILVLKTGLWYDSQTFFDEMKRGNPNIVDATIAFAPPYDAKYGYLGVSWEGSSQEVQSIEFTQIFCDPNYANVFGLELLEGEFISSSLNTQSWFKDTKPDVFNIVINETFKKLMGVDNPIGITVHYDRGGSMSGKIIGVVKDFNFKPLSEAISPLIISFNPEACSTVFIKTTGKDKEATLDYILKKYKEMQPKYFASRPADYNWVTDHFNKMYEVPLRTAKILTVFAFISLALSLLGIFSMIAFMVEKRTKELAIRKINGAKILDIMKLFISDILKVALAATIIAIPICYVLITKWLESYSYKTTLSWWIFLLVPALIMLFTAILVGMQVFFTARQNPVVSLRSE